LAFAYNLCVNINVTDFNPEELSDFKVPQKLLEKIFELSGDSEHNKGFILCMVDQTGKPLVFTKSQNQIVEMGLRKSLEKYLIELEENENLLDPNSGDLDF
tara:strand:- start:7882 stop:8184 length:303 start_codon:yes stop_codon:yes gene_type:complete